MKNCFEAYDQLSIAYRKHLGITDGAGVVFCDVIVARLRELTDGADKRDASQLKSVLEEIRSQQPKYTRCMFFSLCEELVAAESLGD